MWSGGNWGLKSLSRSHSYHLTNCMLHLLRGGKKKKNISLHLVTRSFAATLPRNSSFPFYHMGPFPCQIETCGNPADSKLSNGWHAKFQRAAQTEKCHKQTGCWELFWCADLCGVSHRRIKTNSEMGSVPQAFTLNSLRSKQRGKKTHMHCF